MAKKKMTLKQYIQKACAALLLAGRKFANALHERPDLAEIIMAVDKQAWATVSRITGTEISNRDGLVEYFNAPGFNKARINDLVLISRAEQWDLLGKKSFKNGDTDKDGNPVAVSVSTASVAKHARAVLDAQGKTSAQQRAKKANQFANLAREIDKISKLQGMLRKQGVMTILSGLVVLDVLSEEDATKLL